MKKIYFLCSGKSNRAQIAEGFARIYFKGEFEWISTSYPDEKPLLKSTINIMNEIGIDISGYKSPAFNANFFKEADYIISICENSILDMSIIPTNAEVHHIQIEEPLQYDDYFLQIKSYRQVRDRLGVIIKELSLKLDSTVDIDLQDIIL
ncbi:MAG: hypothetical protein KBT36_17595 [Kurthia sp.]|nr:hypothetical protein [Candidatus Kurthia equi]